MSNTPLIPAAAPVASAAAAPTASHVFLNGSDMPARWKGRERFVILETGFGAGLDFLATWAAWHDGHDASGPCRLHYIAIEKHPYTRDDLAQLHAQLCDSRPGLS